MLNRRQFLSLTPAMLTTLVCAPSILGRAAEQPDAATSSTPPKIGRSSRTNDIATLRPGLLTTTSPKVCKILQFTDLHFFLKTEKEDAQTVEDFKKHMEHQKPDLVVVSGDLWHDNPEGRGWRGLDLTLKSLVALGVPWTMVWGNHDLLDDYQRGHDLLAQAPHSLYRGAETHGDYRLEVRGASSDEKAGPLLDLFFLNTGDEGLTAWQIHAFRKMAANVAAERTKPIPAFAFFHIPILEYETRINASTMKGVKLEGIGRCKEDGKAFPALTAPKTIRACFCGHNHTNDYMVKADEVDLVYGRSSGYAGYGGEKVRKGAKLIEIDLATGKYEQISVFADGTKQLAKVAVKSSAG